MKKVAIFSDVDGTIYPFPSGILSKKNKDKVNEIVDRGVEFIINTGNGPYDKIKNLANNLKARYIIFSNGAFIYDNFKDEILNIEYIDHNEAKKVWDLAKELELPLYYFGTHRFFLKDATDKHRKFFTEFCQYSNWIENGEIPHDLHKIETYGSYDKVKEFYKLAKERKINLNIVDLDRHIEITKPGISKGSGIKWICQNVLNIDVNDVMAIGDSQNDISMFQIVGYPYLMENSDPYTRTFGKYFTSTVDQDGLAEAIDDYLYRVDFDLKREISQQKSNKQQN